MAGNYDHIIRRFLEEEGGVIVYLSDDTVFTRALRNIVSRVIGFKGEVLFPFARPSAALEKCQELRDKGIPTVIFIERMLGERPTTDFVITLMKECPHVKAIILAWEATQGTVAYLFEIGVSRVLLKPASADKVIQEMAATITPPNEIRRHINRCKDFLTNGDFDEALEVTDKILLIKPDSARGLAMRGDALMGIGETDKAVQAYMAAHESRPIFMAPLVRLAEAFKDMDDERAMEYLKTLDEISPLNPERKIDIAEQHLRRNETEEAEVYLDQGVEVAERETLSMVGDLTERIVDAVSSVAPNLAVKYLNRVIDNKRVLGRDDLVHFNRLGIILRGQGKWGDAVVIYDKALDIVPDDPVVHYNKGLAYWEGNERTRALECFETALKLDPKFYHGSVGAALNIGSLYLDLRQYYDAEPFFEHVLQLDPDNKAAQKRLAKAKKRIPSTRAKSGSTNQGSSYDMDAMVGGGSPAHSPKARKPSGKSTSYDMDAMTGGTSTSKRTTAKKPSNKDDSYNMDALFGGETGTPKSKKKKKSKGKPVDLNF